MASEFDDEKNINIPIEWLEDGKKMASEFNDEKISTFQLSG